MNSLFSIFLSFFYRGSLLRLNPFPCTQFPLPDLHPRHASQRPRYSSDIHLCQGTFMLLEIDSVREKTIGIEPVHSEASN